MGDDWAGLLRAGSVTCGAESGDGGTTQRGWHTPSAQRLIFLFHSRLLLLLPDGRTAIAVSAACRVKVVPRAVDFG